MRYHLLDSNNLALWQNQHEALTMCDQYFASGAQGAGLVHMPTGTGKTAIIAVAASLRAFQQPVLIACPSAALIHQLHTDVSDVFWDRIRAPADWKPKCHYFVGPSEFGQLKAALNSDNSDRLVIFSTIQALVQLKYLDNDALNMLKTKVGTIIFDEGHREPALVWGSIIREFNLPTILCTATPFRNDLKIFNIDNNYIYFLSFHQAIENRLIRNVTIDESLVHDPGEFVSAVIHHRDALIRNGARQEDVKVIVRCASESSINTLYAKFGESPQVPAESFLAIHHTFGDRDPTKVNRVPRDLRDHAAKFLLHQFMLTEGIDDPRCSILAIYEPFSTERALVQQIGRIVRHPDPTNSDAPPALVLANAESNVLRMWERYKKFDIACVNNNGKPPIRSGPDTSRRLSNALPEMDYANGRFRFRIDLTAPEIERELRFPKACIIFRLAAEFDLDEFKIEMDSCLEDDDRDVQRAGPLPNGSGYFHLSLALHQSPFLEEALFQQPTLEVTIYVRHENWLFLYDSAGLWVDELCGGLDRVSPAEMRILLPEDGKTVVSMLAVKNSDLGPSSIRSRQYSAVSVAAAVPFMGDHMNIISRASGRKDKTRRYVGFLRARLRDGEAANCTAEEYYTWAAGIAGELESAVKGASLFERFARPTVVPNDPTPLNILFDLDGLSSSFIENQGDDGMRVSAACLDVHFPNGPGTEMIGSVAININGKDRVATVRWDKKKGKYWISSSDLEKFRLKDDPRITLLRRLNQRQPFRIIPSTPGAIYAVGKFYSTDLRLDIQRGSGAALLDLMTPILELDGLASEKGELASDAEWSRSGGGWPSSSLFGFIDKNLKPTRKAGLLGDHFKTIVCDDIGAECADFICMDEHRLVFLHAKCGTGSIVAASELYDVCAQAAKNLAYLKSDNQELPRDTGKWNREWTLQGHSVPRIRCGLTTAAEIRKQFALSRRKPTTRRQVWLCLARMFSKSSFETGMRSVRPNPNIIHSYHLLNSLHVNCQSLGVDLKIYCSP